MSPRLRTRLAAGYFLVLIALSIWPFYPAWGNHLEPRVLGLPWSIVYVLLIVLASFAGLVAFYLLRVVDGGDE